MKINCHGNFLAATVVLVLLGASQAQGRVQARVSDPERSCLKEFGLGAEFAKDAFYRPMRMRGGPYKGECLDNRQRRSAPMFSIKSSQDRKLLRQYGITMKKGFTYFANFKHHNHYYIAEYPNNSIQTTYLVFEKFLELGGRSMEKANKERAMTGIVLSGHIQLRFKLKKGAFITLYPQYRGFTKIRKVNDFAYAMFAVRPKSTSGQKFDPLGDGLHRGYVMSQNFMSTYDTALSYKSYVNGKTQVGQFLIDKDHFDAERAFQALLKESNKDYHRKTPVFYSTWTKNCVTATYAGIDAGAKNISFLGRLEGFVIGSVPPRLFTKTIATGGREWNPLFVLHNLERRGIIKNRRLSEVQTLNEEVCDILKGEDRREISQLCP